MGIAPAPLLQPDQAGLNMDWKTVGPLLGPENRLLNDYNGSANALVLNAVKWDFAVFRVSGDERPLLSDTVIREVDWRA